MGLISVLFTDVNNDGHAFWCHTRTINSPLEQVVIQLHFAKADASKTASCIKVMA